MGRKVGRVGGRVEGEGRLDGKGWMGKEVSRGGEREVEMVHSFHLLPGGLP